MKSNLKVLAAQKGQRENRRITLRTIADETGVSRYTIYAMDKNELNEFPKSALETLCTYFGCSLGELLLTEDAPAPGVGA